MGLGGWGGGILRGLLRFEHLNVVYYESLKREPNIGLAESALRTRNPHFVYYESLKRELKTKTIFRCRCDERLKN